nr:maturase [Candidatus Tectomicrobia bacterium]
MAQDEKGRERRPAETLLTSIQDRGPRGLPLEDVSRHLCTPEMDLRAYARLQGHSGALPPGATADTVAGMTQANIAPLRAAMRYERWPWPPVRRVERPQSNGKTRP